MAISADLKNEITMILDASWDERDGIVVPDTDSVSLKKGVVKIDASFLYADLAGSSKLAQVCPWGTTAKIIRAYLNCATRLIKHYGGEIRSFDGDRVMGVFMGDSKNTNAVRCAYALNWIVSQVLNPLAKEKFDSIKNNGIEIRHCVGIDTGDSRAVRAGIRDNNDLIWIGRAPSLAAKLSDLREYPYSIFISKKVYNSMQDYVKFSNQDGTKVNMWYSDTMMFAGETENVCKSSWHWAP